MTRRNDTASCLLPGATRMVLFFPAVLILVFASLFLCPSCSRKDQPGKGEEEQPGQLNVVLISIDTLRSDHLGCYGYGKDTSPNIDGLAKRGVTFLNSLAQAPATLISHASMLTGLLPSSHRADASILRPLSKDFATLPELLKARGYHTAAFTGGAQIDDAFGLAQGFDIYFDGDRGPGGLKDKLGVKRVYEEASRWLAERPSTDEPFLLFFHTYEVHHPYAPPESYAALFDAGYTGSIDGSLTTIHAIDRGDIEVSSRDLEHMIALYDGEIRYTDEYVGRLISDLERLGLDGQTMVIVTSDHGEEFDEHGRIGMHSHTLFGELLRVPLIIFAPAKIEGGGRIDSTARGIDLVPTVLDTLGLAPLEDIHGTSLLPAVAGKVAEETFHIAEMESFGGSFGVTSIQNRRFKLIMDKPGPILFDLEQDPGEKVNTVFMNKAQSYDLLDKLSSVLTALKPGIHLLFSPVKEEERFRVSIQSIGECQATLDPALNMRSTSESDMSSEITMDIPEGEKRRHLLLEIEPPESATRISIIHNESPLPPDRLFCGRESLSCRDGSAVVSAMKADHRLFAPDQSAPSHQPWVRIWTVGIPAPPLEPYDHPELTDRLKALGYAQ